MIFYAIITDAGDCDSVAEGDGGSIVTADHELEAGSNMRANV